jgi:hypothetical protein
VKRRFNGCSIKHHPAGNEYAKSAMNRRKRAGRDRHVAGRNA